MVSDDLDALRRDRREAVRAFLDEPIGDCTGCRRPITRSTPHRLAKDGGFEHLQCDEPRTPAA